MTSEKDMTVSFVGTRKTDDGVRQLAFSVNDQVFFVPADARAFTAGERIVKFAKNAIEMHAKAVKQGLIEA